MLEPRPIRPLTQELLEATAQQARATPRLRQNHNFHELGERVQRFVNVLQPGTYVRPHCHLRAPGRNGFEFFLVLHGALGILILDAAGSIIQQECVSALGPTRGLEVAQGTYHTLIALAPDTAILEIKEGPYEVATDKNFLEGYPLEGTPEAQAQVAAWEPLFSESLK
ncbi:WbuC family cupin fold metalloprotein [Anthocerotibacter panamensis]|uniref:WbuC family cupin fold metalloprotein n=1 Tax=Anthocerotibacter panamensis TaxID=2857077 RepID=UPI001C401EB4|nr:WbuC family cupin fold metalloprotein [Anthocerotibacter panamensis]